MTKAKVDSGIKIAPDGFRVYRNGEYMAGIGQDSADGFPLDDYRCYIDADEYMDISSLVDVLTALLDAANRIQKEN